MLRLIAIRPLEGCKDYAMKCLHTAETYYFSNMFDVAENGRIVRRTERGMGADERLYQINGGPTKLMLSAIVGKNGDGKSSIVELMMRLINNYAASTLGMMKEPGSLVIVKGVCAELFYLLDKGIYRLYDREGEGIARLEKVATILRNGDVRMLARPEAVDSTGQLEDEFFYTMVSNYSHYSYNVNDFRSEWARSQGMNQTSDERCWLYHIFHKNDGYRTPLVLNPYRNRGIIDINREAFLTQQRLISLFLDAEAPGRGRPTFREMYGKVASHVALEDPGISKLQEKTIKEYFTWVKNDSLLDDVINRTKVRSHNLVDGGEVYINSDECISLLKIISNKWIQSNKILLGKIQKWDKDEKNKKSALGEDRGFLTENSDLSNWMVELEQTNFGEKEEEKKALLREIEPFKTFNMSQLQRIGLIKVVCEAVAGKMKGCQVNEEDQFYLTSKVIALDYDDLTMRQKCEHYIVYKIISIFETYIQEYKKPHRFFNSLINGNQKIPTTYIANGIDKLWADIKQRPSHVTLKLRQALYYRKHYLKGNADCFELLNLQYLDESARINAALNQGRQADEEILYLIIPLDSLKNEIRDSRDLERLPPPIYYTHVVFTSQEDSDKVMMMETLSSGERQRLVIISGIIYHLRNINTIDDEGIKYHNVNVILEEIELYFHPESQRMFIKELVGMIERANLTEIKSVHILIVTHSPFVLSDILKSNVLMLEKGRPAKIEQPLRTFGANYYEMLDTGFFMEKGAIGEFALYHIGKTVEGLNEWYKLGGLEVRQNHNLPRMGRLELLDRIRVIDDRIIRESLMGRYDDVFESDTSIDDEIKMYQERIEELEKKRRNVVHPEA